MSDNYDINARPEYDKVIQDIADYMLEFDAFSDSAMETAHYCLMDSLGCAFLALRFPECNKLLGPVVEGTIVPNGSRVPGTQIRVDPVKAAWDTGCIIRWLDFNDTWLAAEWGHPSDNLGAILSVADHISQNRVSQGKPPLLMEDVLKVMIKAHEIQGVLALENSFNRVGLCHVLLVRVASTAASAYLMGASREEMMSAISHAWVDGSSLRTYRHAPNAGSRKSWAAGDASARGVSLATLAIKGEMGIPSALTAEKWGFYDVCFSRDSNSGGAKSDKEKVFRFPREYSNYVMENILFKISYPAEFHAQTACEAAITLHYEIGDRIDDINKVVIHTHESAIRIISKVGTLDNPADRDHCLQYMTAVCLIFGELKAELYENNFHTAHPQIDKIRERMTVIEEPQYSRDYLDPEKRSIANAVQVFFNDGTSTEKKVIEYPLGHMRRRKEGIPALVRKFEDNVSTRFPQRKVENIMSLCNKRETLMTMPVNEFMASLVI